MCMEEDYIVQTLYTEAIVFTIEYHREFPLSH